MGSATQSVGIRAGGRFRRRGDDFEVTVTAIEVVGCGHRVCYHRVGPGPATKRRAPANLFKRRFVAVEAAA